MQRLLRSWIFKILANIEFLSDNIFILFIEFSRKNIELCVVQYKSRNEWKDNLGAFRSVSLKTVSLEIMKEWFQTHRTMIKYKFCTGTLRDKIKDDKCTYIPNDDKQSCHCLKSDTTTLVWNQPKKFNESTQTQRGRED